MGKPEKAGLSHHSSMAVIEIITRRNDAFLGVAYLFLSVMSKPEEVEDCKCVFNWVGYRLVLHIMLVLVFC